MEYLETIWLFISQKWLTITVGLLGFATSVYLYSKGKKSRTPTYIVRTINLVRESVKKIDTVEILYSKEKVQNLSVSKIALWNDGRETINANDVALKDTVRLVIVEDFKFLDAKILYQKNQANDFDIKISEDNKRIEISFDYFDFEEGVVLQVFHTGGHNNDIHIEGTIKTVGKIARQSNYPLPLPKKILEIMAGNNKTGATMQKITRKLFPLINLILGIIIMLLGVLIPFLENSMVEVTEEALLVNVETVILTVILISLGALYTLIGYNLIRRRIPKGFNIFNEEF